MIADFRDLLAAFVGETDFVRLEQVVQLGLPPYRIDIMTSVSGVDFAQGWSGRLAGTLFGVPVAFLGREAFILNKRASGRPKDVEDIRVLKSLSTH